MSTLREFPQLAYVTTVMGDAWGYPQRSPELQVVPEHFLDRVRAAELELKPLSDTDLDELGSPSADGVLWDELESRLGDVIEVIDHIFQDELHAAFFVSIDEQYPEEAVAAQAGEGWAGSETGSETGSNE